MPEPDALQGLNCPKCGGMITIPEGQAIVLCPYCELRSFVQGERGVRRYQVPTRTTREQAEAAFRGFLSGNVAIAPTARKEAQLTEVFLMHLPFWSAWGQALGWIFGQKQVGSGDSKRYEPREVRVAEDMDWNTAACDVGEFGVNRITLQGRPLEPFNGDGLHASGMVFEPVGSDVEALNQARQDFEARIQQKANLDRVSQVFSRILRPRLGVVYYPLWVMRYLFRGRSFQVVVDGFNGKVAYGKAPGNVLYRAAVLVGGMAAGAFLTVDVSYLLALTVADSDDGIWAPLISLAIGLGLMYFSYRKYRYGEHYEYRQLKPASPGIAGFDVGFKDIVKIAKDLEHFS